MKETTFYLSIFLFSIILAFKFLSKKRRRVNLPPGPIGLPIIGHLHLVTQPLHRCLHRLSEKYGPVMSLRFGTRPIVVVSSPSVAEECFTKNDVVLADRPHLLVSKHLGYDHSYIISSSYGDHWRNLRRISTLEVLSSTRITASIGIRKDEIRRLLRKLCRESRDGGFAKVEMKSRLSELTFNIIMRMVAGRRLFGDEEESRRVREMLKGVVRNGGVSNPLEFVPLYMMLDDHVHGLEKSMTALAKKMDKFLQELIEEHRVNKNLGDTMINRLLSFQETQPEYYTDQIIKGPVLVMFVAGTDTSSVTLEWAMSNLLLHPEIMMKAKFELDTQLGQDRLIDEPDISKLPYLQNIISETLRLYPAAPLLMPHVVLDDCCIGGFDVPRGTMLLVNAWAIHRDLEVWDNPTSCRPERFENGPVKAQNLLPFGMGRRACPGAMLATKVMTMALGSLIQSFEWEKVGDEKIDMTEGKGVIIPKVVPLETLCKPRPIINKFLAKVGYNLKCTSLGLRIINLIISINAPFG